MKKHFAAFTFFVSLGTAQNETAPVRGEVHYAGDLAGNHLTVELVDSVSHRAVDRAFVAGDGSFELRHAEVGSLDLRVVTPQGEVLASRMVDTRAERYGVSIEIPGKPAERPASGPVSVAMLRHKPAKKVVARMTKAASLARQGDHQGAAAALRAATAFDPQFSPAFTNLGVELLRLGDNEGASEAFRRALALDPATASNYSNLAFGLMTLQQDTEAEQMARQGVRLAPADARAHCVLGYLLARKGAREEAIGHLRLAAREVAQAHLALAQLLQASGQRAEAAAEIDCYAAATGASAVDVEKWKAGLR